MFSCFYFHCLRHQVCRFSGGFQCGCPQPPGSSAALSSEVTPVFLVLEWSGARSVKSCSIPTFPMTLSYTLEESVPLVRTAAVEIATFLRMEVAKLAKPCAFCCECSDGFPRRPWSKPFSRVLPKLFLLVVGFYPCGSQ